MILGLFRADVTVGNAAKSLMMLHVNIMRFYDISNNLHGLMV